MRLVNEGSLALTLDAVNEALFSGRRIPRPARVEAAAWMVGRQGLPGCYASMFAPTEQDFAEARVFTGETIASRAASDNLISRRRHAVAEQALALC